MIRWDSLDYRAVLRAALETMRQSAGPRYTLTRLAEKSGVQKTYMSRALAGQGSLSADQVYRACRFLHLTADETDYLGLLVDYDRSEVEERRDALLSKIGAVAAKQARTEGQVDVVVQERQSPESIAAYYLDPMVQVVHIALSVGALARDVDVLRRRLDLSKERFAEILGVLQRLDLVAARDGALRLLKDFIHLSSESPLYRNHAVRTRLGTMHRIANAAPDEGYHFSVVFSADEPTRAWLQQRLLAVLAEARAKIEPASSAHVYQLNLDLFSWI